LGYRIAEFGLIDVSTWNTHYPIIALCKGSACSTFHGKSDCSLELERGRHQESGFRSVHAYAALHTGQEVDFQHAIAGGKARVMWNRIADDRVETGFLVI
jgi:hypothetical protein